MSVKLVKGLEVEIDPRTLEARKIWWPKHKWVEYGIFGGPALKARTFFYEKMKEVEKPLVVDVGASVGSFSLLVKGHGSASAIAFEPNPWVREILESNIKCNRLTNRVWVLPFALYDTNGSAELKIPDRRDESGFSCLGMPKRFGKYVSLEVKTKRLDEFRLRPGLIKLDVEGCEFKVLLGAEQTIKEHHPGILFEADARNTAQFDLEVDAAENLLRSWGYQHFEQVTDEDIWASYK